MKAKEVLEEGHRALSYLMSLPERIVRMIEEMNFSHHIILDTYTEMFSEYYFFDITGKSHVITAVSVYFSDMSYTRMSYEK